MRIDSRVKERKLKRSKTREHERREFCIDCREDLEKSLQAECADERCHIFLMPDEEHLCGFSQMGFHVKCCLYVYLMNILVLNKCRI